MKTSHFTALLASVGVLLCLGGCSTYRKLDSLRSRQVRAELRLDKDMSDAEFRLPDPAVRDTVRLDDDNGGTVFLMKAIRDDETGDMVASEELDAAFITARFRNVSERHGKVELRFDLVVKDSLLDNGWQLRLQPVLAVLGDTLELEPVIVTGSEFRKGQLRGYQQYERFLSSLSRDSLFFVNYGQLEKFIERNLPAVYAFRNDTTIVSDEAFESSFGVTYDDALSHYTNAFLVRRNATRIGSKSRRLNRYVPNPILSEGIRLDTVISSSHGFVYQYTHVIETRPELRKAEIFLSGEILDRSSRLYSIPETGPLTFYISSLSSLVDPTEKFLKKVVQRQVNANSTCWVEFAQGSSVVDLSLGSNMSETGRIRSNLVSLLSSEEFVVDSVLVTASCSPEGSLAHNRDLSMRRSRSVSGLFDKWSREILDSLAAEKGTVISIGESVDDDPSDITLIPRSNPENWLLLDQMVGRDTVLTEDEKAFYRLLSEVEDLDVRERSLQRMPCYRYLRGHLYPYLRTVRFDFCMHRRGFVQDTVVTTVPDTLYAAGVLAIRDRDYERALSILRPYHDFNTAVALCSLDYNASALEILEGLEPTAPVLYMLALVKSRRGDPVEALKCFARACQLDPSFRFRGNLDPEISALLR